VGHLHPEDAASCRTHSSGKAVNCRDNLARRRAHRVSNRVVHKRVLQVDHNERCPRRVKIGKAMLAAPSCNHALDQRIWNGGTRKFHPHLLALKKEPIPG
jgi:hypothetical protein